MYKPWDSGAFVLPPQYLTVVMGTTSEMKGHGGGGGSHNTG